ncbi:aminoglycoside adenylyltransferase domain-containing protein [Micromonospora sp. HM5-17]|uniref:aminoglycoside adenylyltransferase domain-containing protein n=1 Tax=Micromonospora sp. HM5-17 TaxID=2487710 RepID=UPI000F49861A|nr:aminoglycoside adenylyltransferase domain-containing protein [Micromonospora sp. HM5-17]ROT29457.1 DUF4111 domain-containing protein [Micromonospora sp. HM5-17]
MAGSVGTWQGMAVMSTLPAAEAAYLTVVVDRLRAVFGEALLGVYPTGSLALHGYTPGRSDLDLIAVVERADAPVLADVAARLSHDALPCPATGLEFVLYERAAVAVAGTGAGFALNLNTGRELPPRVSFGPDGDESFWYPIDRSISRQQGVALLGPPPATLLAPVPFEALMSVVIESIDARLRAAGLDLGDNAVLNACRSLRFAVEGRWYAKRLAAEWAVREAPEFGTLIHRALDSYGRGRAAGTAVGGAELRAFLGFVLDRLRRHQPAAGHPPTRHPASAH